MTIRRQRQFIFIDFTPYIHLFANFHSRSFFDPFRLMYPAPAVVSYRLLLLGGGVRHPHFATWRFVGIMVATSWILMLLVGRSLVRRGLAPRSTIKFLLATYFLSFPFWFEVHQANLEFVVWIVIIVGLGHSGRTDPIRAAMFGVAISMKIFPFMYLGLLVARKEFRQAVFASSSPARPRSRHFGSFVQTFAIAPTNEYRVDLFRKMMFGRRIVIMARVGAARSSKTFYSKANNRPGSTRAARIVAVFWYWQALHPSRWAVCA